MKTKIRPSDIDEGTEIKEWKQYAYEYGTNNGLNEMEARTFADVCSYFIADGAVVNTDHPEYKMQAVQFDILAALPDIRQIDDETEQVKTLFDFIFIIFDEKIYKYAKKSKRLDFRVTQKQLVDFMSVPGKNKSEKLERLLHNYYKKM